MNAHVEQREREISNYENSARQRYNNLPQLRLQDYEFLDTANVIINNPGYEGDPEVERERVFAAALYANAMGTDIGEVYQNLDVYHEQWTGEGEIRKGALRRIWNAIDNTALRFELNLQGLAHRNRNLASFYNNLSPDTPMFSQERTEWILNRLEEQKDDIPRPWQENYIKQGGIADLGIGMAGFGLMTIENLMPMVSSITLGGGAGAAAKGVGTAIKLTPGLLKKLVAGTTALGLQQGTAMNTVGIEYLDLLSEGIPEDIAWNNANLSAQIQGVIENIGGGVTSTITGGLIKTAMPNAASLALNRWFISGKLGAGAKAAANYFQMVVGETFEEGMQEVTSVLFRNRAVDQANERRDDLIERIANEPIEAIRIELEKELENHPEFNRTDFDTAWQQIKEASIAGFGTALWLGGFGSGVNYRNDVRSARDISRIAQASPNEAVFKEALKESGISVPLEDFENKPTDEQNAILSDIYRVQQERLTPEQREAVQKAAQEAEALAEVTDYSQSDIASLDDPDSETKKGKVYRENERLYLEDERTQNEDGTETGRTVFGDPTDLNENRQGRRDGYVNYTITKETIEGQEVEKVTIDEFKMTEGQEDQRGEFWANFTEQFGKDTQFEMNFKNEANQAIKQQLIDNNPRGPKHGLNYSMASTDAQKLAKMITPLMKEGTSSLETALAGEIVHSILKKPGESLQGVVNRLNIKFTNKPNAAIQAAQSKGGVIQGAHWTEGLGKDVQRLIYISKHGDPSTLMHEPAHIAAKNFTPAERARAAKALNGYTITKGDYAGTTVYFDDFNAEWINADGSLDAVKHEAFADAFENFLTNGTVPNEEIRPLFEKIKEFMKRIYQTITGWTEMSPELQNFMKEFVTGELRENTQQEAQQTHEEAHQQTQTEKTIDDTEQTENATEAQQDTARAKTHNTTSDHILQQAREQREAIINNPNLPLEEKAQAVFEAAEDALYQTAYHGSAIRFDQFDSKYMGTGVGAQAYGWGHYFTSKKQLADWYRTNNNSSSIVIDGKQISEKEADNNLFLYNAAVEGTLDNYIKEMQEILAEEKDKNKQIPIKAEIKKAKSLLNKKVERETGQLYKVDIPDNENLLNWDKDIKSQKNVLERIREQAKKEDIDDILSYNGDGHFFYRETLANMLGSEKEASLFLSRANVKGIRYTDKTSPGAQGTGNYVIFDDSAIQITNTLFQTSESWQAWTSVIENFNEAIEEGGVLDTPKNNKLKKRNNIPRLLKSPMNIEEVTERIKKVLDEKGVAYHIDKSRKSDSTYIYMHLPSNNGFGIPNKIRIADHDNYQYSSEFEISLSRGVDWAEYKDNGISEKIPPPTEVLSTGTKYYAKSSDVKYSHIQIRPEKTEDAGVLFQAAYNTSANMLGLDREGYYEHGWGRPFYSRIETAEWVKSAMEKISPIVPNINVANIPDDQRLLHWDKTIAEQPETVREALDKIITWDKNGKSEFNRAYNLRRFDDGSYGFYRTINGKMKWDTIEAAQTAAKEEIKKELTGEQLYKVIESKIGKKDTSLLLSRLGIKGTKYFDHSLGKIGITKGHNYVIYDDSAVQLIPQISAPLYQIIGERGADNFDRAEEATVRLDNLDIAEQMEKAGKETLAIRFTTGWERGADGKWRYEIDDGKILDSGIEKLAKMQEESLSHIDLELALEELYDNEALFKAYPTLRTMPVIIDTAALSSKRGLYDPEFHIITISAETLNEGGEGTLVHEIQHAIQWIEGFAQGGSPEGVDKTLRDKAVEIILSFNNEQQDAESAWRREHRMLENDIERYYPPSEREDYPEVQELRERLKKVDDDFIKIAGQEAFNVLSNIKTAHYSEENSVNLYKRLAGEVEARNATKRFGWNSRRHFTLAETEDVARKDQIFIEGGLRASQITNTLFQTDMEKMVEEAATFEDGKDYRGYIEAFHELPDVIDPWWSDEQIDAWFDEFVKQSKNAKNNISLDGIESPTSDSLTAADVDADFLNEIEQEGKLEEFVQTIAGIQEDHSDQDDGLNDLRSKLQTEFKDQGWQMAIKTKGRMGDTQRARLMTLIRKAPRDYRAIYAEVMEREDLSVSHEDTTTEALKGRLDQDDIRREEVEKLTPEKRRQLSAELDYEAYAEKVNNGTAQFDDPQHKEHLKRLNEKIVKAEETLAEFEADRNEDNLYIERQISAEFNNSFEKVLQAKEKLRSTNQRLERAVQQGEKDAARFMMRARNDKTTYDNLVSSLQNMIKEHRLEIDIQALLSQEKLKEAARAAKTETTQNYLVKLDAIKEEYKDFKKSAKSEATLIQRLARRTATEGLRAQINEMNAQRKATKEITKAKRGVVKRIFRRISPAEVNAEQGITIAIIQNFAEPSFMKGVNEFINEIVEHDLKPVFEQWKVDEQLRKNLIRDKHPATRRKMRQLFSKEFDQLTADEKKYLARKIAPEDWVQELDLEKIAERRRENYPITDEQKQLAEKYLPKDIYYRIMDKPFNQWTLAEAEQLAKIIDDLTVQGKNMYKAHIAAEKKRIQSMRDAAIKEIGTVKRKTWTGRDRTDEEMEKILGKYYVSKDGTLQSDSERKKVGSIVNFHLINMYRFSRLLDNDQVGGINQTLLYRAGEDAYNQKMRAVDLRTKIVMDKLETLGFKDKQINELWKTAATIDHGGQLGERKYTAWDLLGFTLAEKNNYTREALMYGNMLDERERAEFQRPGVIPEQMVELELIAGDRFMNVQAAARKLIAENPNYQKIIDAMSEDFKASAPRINQALINYNNTIMETLDDYFPMDRVMPVGHKANDSMEQREIMGSAGGAFNLYVEKGFSHSRIDIPMQYQTAIKLDLMTVWADAVEKQEHFIAYAKPVKDLNKIYKQDRHLRQSIESRWGKEANNFIDDYIMTLVNPNQEKIKGALDKLLKGLNVRGRTSSAYLGWKLSGIWLQAVTSPATFGAYLNPYEYWSNFFSYMTSGMRRGKQWQEICDISPHMKHRSANMMTALIKEMAKDKTVNKVDQKINKFNKVGTEGLTWIDNVCVVAGWKGLFQKEYTRLSKEGILSAEEIRVKAGQYADDIVGAIQPDSRPEHYAPMYRDAGYLGKSLIQFTQSLNVQFQTLYDIPYFVRTNQIEKAVGLVISFAIAGLVLGWTMEGFDDDDDEDEKLKKVLYWTTLQFSESVPLMGSLASSLAEKAITGEGRISRTGEGLFPQLNSIEKGLSSSANGNIVKGVSSFVEAFMLATGLPVSGAKEIKNVFMDREGEAQFNPGALLRRKKDAKWR